MTKRIRPKGTITVMEAGTAQIPKEIRDELGIVGKGEIAYVVSSKIAVLYNVNTKPNELFKAIEVLLDVLKLRVEECAK